MRQPYSFRAYLGPCPLTNDKAAAVEYHIKIIELIDRDDLLPTHHPDRLRRCERQQLQFMNRRWLARVQGRDMRWNLIGAKGGRLYREIEEHINPKRERESLAWRRALNGER